VTHVTLTMSGLAWGEAWNDVAEAEGERVFVAVINAPPHVERRLKSNRGRSR